MLSHKIVEKSSFWLILGIIITISIGGWVEIVPLYHVQTQTKPVEGMRPYTGLELMGRNIYIREGCYSCHSQMIRRLSSDVERYGPASLPEESMYDHPFQWGSKRTGPDLARVGGKYSNEWHLRHLINPRSMVQESIMPAYAFLQRPLNVEFIPAHLRALQKLGVPYTKDHIDQALADIKTQLDPLSDQVESFLQRYPKAVLGKFDPSHVEPTEMDALIAYLQVLGSLAEFPKPQQDSKKGD
jgi:cytochrome c oxidase cbb3-type subunit 2